MKKRIKGKSTFLDYYVFFGVCFLLIMGIGHIYFSNINKRTVTVTIKNKEQDVKLFVFKEMIIFTDKGIYRNTNNVIQGKYNEKTVFFTLESTKTCTLTIIGEYTFIFHTAPNILEVKECK